GSGNVTLVAGWNGVSSNTPGSVTFHNGELCDPIISNPGLGIDFNDCESFGNGGASVVLGSATQTSSVFVGTRRGTTTVAGYGLSLYGSNGTDGAATQIGFRPDGSGAVSGAINIFLKGGGLTLQGGNAAGAYTQIGHGGTGAASTTINAPVTISFCEAGDVALTAGNGLGAYAHIGHGGNAWNGDRAGDIRLEGMGELSLTSGATNAYTQIGHGGAALGTVYGAGSGTGSVFVEADGNVFLTGGGGANSYSQIGHGGGRQGGHFEGAVTLLSGGSVEARGGGGDTSSTQIGHGGRSAPLSSIGPGDIRVEAAGDVLLLSGTASYSGSKIGHGNHNQKLSSFVESSVDVVAGRHIRLVSPQFEAFTNTEYASTQIGHGGYGAIVGTAPSTQGYSGNISVTAGGKLDLIAGKNGRSYLWSLIGHTSYFNSTGQHSGDITVTSGTTAGLDEYGVTVRAPSGDFAGAGSSSYYSFAAIGHRGHSNSTGTYSTGLSGDILVDVIRGGVTIEGGNGLVTPDIRLHGAQIGHGGYAAGHLNYGLHGSVRVHAQGDILLRSGTSRWAGVIIGHGGASSFGPMGGADEVIEVISREGSLELDSTVASTTGGGVFIGHGSPNLTSGTRQGDILVDVAGEISLVGNLSTIGHRTSSSGGISNADLTIRARSMDTASGDSGGGLLRLPSFLGSSLTAHLNAGHVSLIGTGNEGIEMGANITSNSAFDLNLLSHSHLSILDDLLNRGSGDIHLIAGWDPSLTPFHPTGETLPPSAGSPLYREYWIRDIDASPALLATPDAYGNGDSVLTIGASNQTGAVRVGTRLGDLVAAGHAVNLYGGGSASAATQLGFHPGATGQGADGDIDLHVKSGGLLLEGGGGQYSYAQIGHGGNGSTDGNQHLGDISIRFSESGDLTLNGGSTYAYAQIGHGGLSLNASHSGIIDIRGNGTARVGDVSLNSGASYAYTQIGHGGGNVGGTTYKGGDANGSIWIDAAGKVTVSAAGQGAYSQIGRGGLVNSNGNYGLAGDRTVVIAENGIELSGGTTSWSYAQIGHGGYQSGGSSKNHQGDIYLNYNPDTGLATGGGEISLSGRKGSGTGAFSATYAQIGHGGRNAGGTKHGDIVIGQSDAITLTGFGEQSYAQIGHGGNGTGPNHTASGSIELNTSGLLQMNSGYGAEAYTLVGHGGYGSGGTANYGLAGESIAVTARAVEMTAGSDLAAFSQIGHGGYRITGTKTADISVETADGISLHAGNGAGEAAYAQIGHGGYQSGGTLSGDISTLASSAIILQAGEGLHHYAQIGHGGTSAGGSRSGSIEVAAIAGIELHGGTGNETATRIGHGGIGASGSADGAVQVASAAHLLLGSGDGDGASAQIGHGGRLSTGATSGIIEVAAALDIDLLGGDGLFSTTQIGHGGFGFGGSVTDQSIAVATAGALTLHGGASNVQIGHGGFAAQSHQLSGDIEIAAAGDIGITGDTGAFAYSQIGNLGMSSNSLLGGDISVTSGGDIDLTAVNGTDAAYAKIGHGHDFPVSLSAFSPVAEITGDILVGAAANISLTDAMIGHLNAASSAAMVGGKTQIGVSLADPADPSGGNLLADAQSEFHGADGLRFYLPQRTNNQIAAGASLNGATFPGAAPDPFDHQRDDEYTRNILGDVPQTPNEHDNLFGTGPSPGNAAGYAFYYDTITLVAGAGLPPETETPDGGDTASPPFIVLPVDTNPLLRWLGLLPDDRTFDDWLRDREKEFSRSGTFRILYENFEQYNQIGLSTFHLDGFPSGDDP
ncbi:MAG: hypothetical protein GXX91_14225, partial [Verrucomicrobiaceae bacterium]|nr:hypothetical protein [Verrucomicrobiaceae bacterium]